MNSFTINKPIDRYAFGLIIICCFAFIIHNDVLSLDIMEARNLVTAREMVNENHWLLPTMNGELRLEKPPLPTWISAIGWFILPQNIFLQRCFAGCSATLLVLYFYFTGVLLFRNRDQAFLSAILLCTSYSTILIGRTASWDIYCHSMMMISIYYLTKGLTQKNYSLKDCIFAGSFLGLSFLSKGPIAFYALLLPFILSFFLIYRTHYLKRKQWIIIFTAALLVGGWWYVYVALCKMDDTIQVFGKESVNWISYNKRPWYYYWSFFLECCIWSILLLCSLIMPLWNGTSWKDKKYLFPLLWTIIGIILLSLIPEKKTRYLFPVVLPCCYLMGNTITHWINHANKRNLYNPSLSVFRTNVIITAAVVLAVPIICYVLLYKSALMTLSHLVCLSAVVLYIEYMLIASACRIDPIKWVKNILFLFIYIECTMFPLLVNLFDYPQKQSISKISTIDSLNQIQFYHSDKEDIRMEIVYAANKPIRPLNFSCSDSIINKLPIIILTHQPVDKEVSPDLWNTVDSVHLGIFDDNHWPKGNRLYNNQFIYHATLLKTK